MKQNKIPRNEYIRKPVGKTNPYKDDVIYDPRGQWAFPGQVTRIPGGDITMSGVPYPMYGVDDLGNSQMMYPGMDYTFPGQQITEYRMQRGGLPPIYTSNKNDPRLRRYNDSLNLYNAYIKSDKNYKELAKKYNLKTWKDNNAYNPGAKIQPISSQGFVYASNGDSEVNGDDMADFLIDKNNKEIQLMSDSKEIKNIFNNSGRQFGSNLHGYKKPVQPVIYQKPEEVITPDYLPMIQTGMPDMVSREPEIIASPTSRPSNTNNRISWRMDPETRKMIPVYLEGRTQKVKEGKRLYNKNIPSSTAAIPADFVPQFEPDQPKDVVSKKMGGWLDELDKEYRRGGSVNPLMRSRSKRASTKKNIQSSINKIFLRNYDLFGPGGKNIYDPKAKYQQGGGWLDNLD